MQEVVSWLTNRVAELNDELARLEAAEDWSLYDYTEGARDAYEIAKQLVEDYRY